MAVYVDNFYETGAGNFGRMKMSHMIADSTEELLQMVDKIGVQRKWIQYPGKPNEHFDICMGKRVKAIKCGAIPINFREQEIESLRKESNLRQQIIDRQRPILSAQYAELTKLREEVANLKTVMIAAAEEIQTLITQTSTDHRMFTHTTRQ